MVSPSDTFASWASRFSMRPSGSSSWKKFRRFCLCARVGTNASGTATDSMGLSMPNVLTASGSNSRSNVRQSPFSAPTRLPYSSTTRSATCLGRSDGGGELDVDLAHHREQPLHEDGRFTGLYLPYVALRGAQALGKLALAQALEQARLLQDPSQRLGACDLAGEFHFRLLTTNT